MNLHLDAPCQTFIESFVELHLNVFYQGLNKGTKKSSVYAVSGTPARLLGTKHFSQTFL